MERLEFSRHGPRVGVTLGGRPVGDLAWDEAAELGHVLFRKGYDAEQNPDGYFGQHGVGHRIVRMAGGRVDVLYRGGLVASMDIKTARAVGRALIAVARQAEEWAKAYQVAADAAVLMRAGMPVGLANHPTVRAEAVKEALHSRDLRRFMQNRVSERSVVGTPGVIQGAKPWTM